MKFEAGYLFGMALQTIPEPRKVAREVLALHFPRAVLWQAFALFAVLSTLLGLIATILFPPDPQFAGTLLADPLRLGIVEASSLVVTVFLIYWMGRTFGGHGSFEQALLTVIWLQYVAFLMQLGVVVLALFAPGMALIFNYLAIGVSFWILSHFIAEMHGFRSTGLVFATILLTIFGVAIAVGLVLTVIGVGSMATPGMMTG